MKTVCQQEKLHAGLTIVNRAAPARSNIPINKNVLIQTEENNQLKMRANNNEISITTWIPAEVESPGEVTLPAKLLSEFISLLPKETITLEDMNTETEGEDKGSQDTHLIKIDCGQAKTHINGTRGDMFPKPPEFEEPQVILINAQEFKTAIDMVAFCAASDQSRPMLTGVQILLDGYEFTMTATDGFRLAQKKGHLEGEVKEPISIMVPTNSLAEFNHIRGDSTQPVRMTIAKNLKYVLFETKTAPPNEYPVEMTSYLLEGDLPQYGQLIPKDYSTRAVFDLKKLTMGVRSAAVFAKEGNNTIRFQVKVNKKAQDKSAKPASPDTENQSAGDQSAGSQDAEEVPGSVVIIGRSEETGDNSAVVDALEMSGEDLVIGFNNKYIMEALNSIGENDVSRVIFQMQTPGSPGVIKTSESDEYIHIIMPMFMKDGT